MYSIITYVSSDLSNAAAGPFIDADWFMGSKCVPCIEKINVPTSHNRADLLYIYSIKFRATLMSLALCKINVHNTETKLGCFSLSHKTSWVTCLISRLSLELYETFITGSHGNVLKGENFTAIMFSKTL